MTPQQFLDFVQIHWRKFGFFPHPAVLRALFGWDFGTRGLSLAHFTRVTEQERRAKVRKFDMSNFSKKNKLPTPTSIATFSALVGAVEVLCNLARQLYQPMVQEAFAAAAPFLGELQVSDLPTSESALAASIQNHFPASHESFVRVYRLILRQDVANALRASKLPAIRDDGSTRGKQRSARIPLAVRKALPKQGEKQVCLRFLSAQVAGARMASA
ncbi:hypothetical protein PHYSODRAFT_489140 [Phytophthora sojae]|uniref:Uncharacterized protein n=1 Tax=Phytophthora sojae (strain P6497) TaxID=1094619 RepID=G4Z6S5_PHYSP|nr:hypothetical protein PHYSODRAFT_489140 [Phytophthora sojae]EGZ20341.1 hypothetical protein PHYSODRAFT_489140 [Phytophthora sojae]|eukprot:XP_009523058.1 hypothetical protein PHYSODRAFT_489140 [Phytophthora sojae]